MKRILSNFICLVLSAFILTSMFVTASAKIDKKVHYDGELLFCNVPWMSSFDDVIAALKENVFTNDELLTNVDIYLSDYDLINAYHGGILDDNAKVPTFSVMYTLPVPTYIANHKLEYIFLRFIAKGTDGYYYTDSYDDYGLIEAKYFFETSSINAADQIEADLIDALQYLYGNPRALQHRIGASDGYSYSLWVGSVPSSIKLYKEDDGNTLSLTYEYTATEIWEKAVTLTRKPSYNGL